MADGNEELRKMKSQLVELEKVCGWGWASETCRLNTISYTYK